MSRRVVWVALVLLLLAGGLLPGKAVASFVLSGQVVTETGAPVEGASVKVTKSRSGYEQGLRWLDEEPEPEVLDATVTDETGWYRVEVPRPGMWRVAVDAPGYVPMERRPEAYIGEERLATMTLVPDAGLKVTVTAAGKPLPNARVWAASTLGPDGPWATFDLRQWRPSWPGRFTDQRGRATVPRARDERLRVVAWKDGFRQVEEADAAGPVRLETEAVAERRVVRVVDAGGKPVKQALIRVGETPSWSAGTTDEQGLWDLAPPGGDELTLRANAGDGRWATETFEAPEEETLVLELPEPTVLSGRVSDAETGASLRGALVFRDRSGRFAETGDDGRYRFVFSEPGAQETVQAVARDHRLSTIRLTMPLTADVSFALQPVYRIRGRVVDRSGAPVAGAEVRLARNRFELMLGLRRFPGGRVSTTDPAGRFLLIQVPESEEPHLLARAEGYAPRMKPVSPKEGGEVVMVLGPGSVLEGRIVTGGQAVAGAEIHLDPEVEMRGMRVSQPLAGPERDGELDTVSDEEGRFRILKLPPGFFTLRVDARGFASRRLAGVEIPEDQDAVDLGDVALEPGAVLEGFVTDDRGRPLSGVRVSVSEGGPGGLGLRMGAPQGPVESEQLTEGDGRFRFDDLEAGSVYGIRGTKEGWVSAQKVTEIPTEEPLELVLGTGGRLFGRVTTASGEPLGRAMVGAQSVPGETSPLAMARAFRSRDNQRLGDDGTFSFEALPPGKIQLHVFDDQGRGSEHGPFEVTAGGEVGPLTLVHEGGPVLEGRVLRSDGAPAAGVHVMWKAADGSGSGVPTDASGRFRLQGLEPGPVTLLARDPKRGRASRELVVHGGVQEVELILEPGLRVTGRVVDPEGRPVTSGRVRLVPAPEGPPSDLLPEAFRLRVGESPLSADGTFAVPVDEAGSYAVRVDAAGFVPWTTPASEPLDVADGSIEGLVIRLERGGRIVGRISGLAEDELSRVRVRAHRDSGDMRPGAVDYRGRYEIRSVDAGSWTVVATTGQPPRQVSRQVVVGEDGGETRLDLTFPEHELTLRGQVLLDGEPVSGAQVFVRSADEPQGVPVTGFTDSFGRFRVAGLVPDRYVVQVFQSSFGRGISLRGYRELEVVADQEIVLDLERVEPETE